MAPFIYFSRNSIEFDANYLQKRSTLNPKLYQSTLQFLLNALDDPTSVITTDSISKYYGSPDKLKETIEDIQSAANDSSPLASLAAAYQITQMSGLKICGTIGVMASLWAQPLDLFKDSCTKIKPFCVPSKIKEAGKIIQEEIKQTKASKLFQKELSLLKRTSSSPRLSNSAKKVSSSESNKSNTYSTSNSATNTHPLMLFNCSRDGPAFGPIIF